MKEGVLIYNPETARYNICFGLLDYHTNLHCGTCMEVMVDGKWVHTRIEFNNDWYLVGIKTATLDGLQVRI